MKVLKVFLLIASVFSVMAAEPSKPNILFIIADDLATRLKCYGDSAAITPNLDRLAAEGVLFSGAYCQGAVCTPSRTSFMLGLNTRHAKTKHFILNPDTMTMGRWFREHGYNTASIGKIDHDSPADEYSDPKAWDLRVQRTELNTTPLPLQEIRETGPSNRLINRLGISDDPTTNSDSLRTERMIKFLDTERDPNKPFFAAIGYHAPHAPLYTSVSDFEAHDPTKFLLEKPPSNASSITKGSMLNETNPFQVDEAQSRHLIKAYYAAVTTLDHEVGRLIEHLRTTGELENTIVVFTSDHGYHLGWRDQWHKHTLFEQVMRVPLIVRHPKGAKGEKAEGLVELLDLFPSFCDYAEIPIPETLDGKSFLPMVLNPKLEGKPAAFCEWGNGRTVRTQDWRLILRTDGSMELYDHRNDGTEYVNLIGDQEHQGIVENLKKMLTREFGPSKKH